MFGYILIALVFATVEYASTADVGEVCTSNTTCTVTNSWCPSSFPGCSSQKCECEPGYDHQNSPSACKLRRYYRDTCSSTDSCQAGSACSSAMCDCTSYNDNLHMCFNAAQKGINEDCTTVADCYDAVTGSTKCAVPTGSSGSQKKCLCNDGYIEEANRCRKPYYDEYCTSAVGCVSRVPGAVTDDTSFATETCTSSKCACPTSNSVVKVLRIDGMKTVFCMASGTGSTAIGGTCTTSNQCNGGFCYKCPGQTNKICIADNHSSSQSGARPGVTLFRELYWIGWVVLFSRMCAWE